MPEPIETTTALSNAEIIRVDFPTSDAPLPVGNLALLLRAEGIAPVQSPDEPWRPGATANDAPFSEMRVVMDPALTETEKDKVAAALQYGLQETIWTGPIPPTSSKVDAEAGETIMEFPLSSVWVGRDCPDFNIAFNVARVRILLGSDPLLTNRKGPGTYCTQEVEGLGKERCGVEFFVR